MAILDGLRQPSTEVVSDVKVLPFHAVAILGLCIACAPSFYDRSGTTYLSALRDLGGPLEVCLVTEASVSAFGPDELPRWAAMAPLGDGDFYARWVEHGGHTEQAADGTLVNYFYYPILVFDAHGMFKGGFRFEHSTTAWYAQPQLPCPTAPGMPLSEMQYVIAAENAFWAQRFDSVIGLLPEAQRVHRYAKFDHHFRYYLEAYPYLAVSYWNEQEADSAHAVMDRLLEDVDHNKDFWDEDRTKSLERRLQDLGGLVPEPEEGFWYTVIGHVRYARLQTRPSKN
jgi:hypothetical protein